eukprot:2147983-Prorocentrum_lima.AAC.1
MHITGPLLASCVLELQRQLGNQAGQSSGLNGWQTKLVASQEAKQIGTINVTVVDHECTEAAKLDHVVKP